MTTYQVSASAHILRPSSEKNTHPYSELADNGAELFALMHPLQA